MAEGVERRLAAILNADVVGYSRLMAEDEADTIRTITAYRNEITALVGEHRGRVVDAPGDELLAELPTARDAVEAAVEIQRVIHARNAGLPAARRMEFRIGIHLGDVAVDGERIYGDGVNIAARLQGLAVPGGICVSASIRDQLQARRDLSYEDLGEQSVKNIPLPLRVYRVRPEVSDAPPAEKRPRLPWGTIAAGVLVLAVLAGGWRLLPAPGPASTGPAEIRSLAVLPLDNLSGDPEQEYFVDGMTEALIANLARLRGVRVISRTSSMAYRNSEKTLPEIAGELNVDAIVEGSVLRAGDRVRITAQLIRASSDEHLWSDSYERDLHDVLALQSEVARAIAGSVEMELTSVQGDARTTRAVDPGAYDAYLKGRYHWNKRTREAVRRAIGYFEQAIALDPDWGLAHAGLAESYVILPIYDPTEVAHDTMPRARAAAQRALELDASLAPARTALGAVRAWYDWDWDASVREFRKGIESDPSYSTGHYWYALVLLVQGGDAIAQARLARELDPLSVINSSGVAMMELYSGNPDGAIREAQHTLELEPDFPLAIVALATAYAEKSMLDEAVEAAERLNRVDASPRARSLLAEIYARAGRREDALRILEELREAPIDPRDLAVPYAALGDLDEAFAWMDRAVDGRSVWVTFLDFDPAFAPLRGDPRFEALRKRIGLPGVRG